jgi:DNA polymerase III epsilon subunit-like protein
MSKIVFLDTETVGLDTDRHDVWEIGLIVRELGAPPEHDLEYLWQVWPDLSHLGTDAGGLRVSRFYEREQVSRYGREALALVEPLLEPGDFSPYTHGYVAGEVARLLDGAHVVGAVPDFDARALRRFLRKHGHALTAHYHLIDIEALAVGYLQGVATGKCDPSIDDRDDFLPTVASTLPWDSEVLSAACGVKPPSAEDRHTALGDARWVRDLYDAITGGA